MGLRSTIARLAALGAVKRRGLGGLESHAGAISGNGHVISAKDGTKTKFEFDGRPATR